MWRLKYLLEPEDSTPGCKDAACAPPAPFLRAAKALLWICLAILTALTLARFG